MTTVRTIVHAKPELELKVASRALVRAAGGGDGSAATLGTRQQRMSDCGLPNTPDFLRVDEVGKLEDVTVGQVGHPHVTRVLAQRQGYELVPLFDCPVATADLLKLMAPRAKEQGEATSALCLALADGTVDAKEAEVALAAIEDELRMTLCIRAALRAIIQEGAGR